MNQAKAWFVVFSLPIFPGRPSIATEAQRRKSPCGILALRNMPVACFSKKKPPTFVGGLCSRYLSSWVGQRIVLPFKKCPVDTFRQQKTPTFRLRLVFALPIFPGSHPPSIVGVHELNFCVRDGNRWTLMTINTNYINAFKRFLLW